MGNFGAAPQVPIGATPCRSDRIQRSVDRRRRTTAAEVAVILGISKVSVYQALAAGALPGFRVGARWLVPMDALDRWLHQVGGRSH